MTSGPHQDCFSAIALDTNAADSMFLLQTRTAHDQVDQHYLDCPTKQGKHAMLSTAQVSITFANSG